MNPAVRLKQITLVLGDIIILYLALGLTLVIRYNELSDTALNMHLEPFSLLFIIWILVFYINNLYEIQRLKNTVTFLRSLGAAIAVNAIIAILFFYFITDYGIAPKTNLFIFLIVVFLLMYVWRGFYNNVVGRRMPTTPTAVIGEVPIIQEIVRALRENPQLGYHITSDIETAELIIVPTNARQDSRTTTLLYHYATVGVEVVDSTTFYELIFEKLPIGELEETWFLSNLINRHHMYDFIRLPIEIFFAGLIGIITLPIIIIIATLVKLTSPGQIIFKQTRIGEFGKQLTLYKFRTMIANAPDGSAEGETGPQWAQGDDPRATPVGGFLRRSHLDELLQLVNIIKGEISFVGPRPERPDFVTQLKEKIPYYELRHLVKPGITGWAQLHYGYGASIKDAYEKLQYDLYYLKNRSLLLDLSIIIKTIKLFFIKP